MGHPRIELLQGGRHTDKRGVVLYNNNFDLTPVKRFYIIHHAETSVVRAWQGHQREHKYFMCIKGSFVVAWKEIVDLNKPVSNSEAAFEILNANESNVLSIPPGYANGLKALLADSKIMIFSDRGLDDSIEDDIRFDKDLWLDWNQF